ncbi:MAG TPA: hypothetical protein VK444_05820 [Methanobacteriaceae archaeon]|nr:hypothetical protein [Methanobacteriaceae archaeon]
MGYVRCLSCGGYYQLEEGESPYEFDRCQCGGDLVYTKTLEPLDESQNHEYIDKDSDYDYIEYYDDDYSSYESYEPARSLKARKNRSRKVFSQRKLIMVLVPLIILMVVGASFTASYLSPWSILNGNDPSILGSDSRGKVTKEVYGTASGSRTIAIVTGMHPREKLAKQVTNDLVKSLSLSASQKIVLYDITVTKNPEDFTNGRKNGEGLAAQYVIPDILKSNDDVVLVCHDHEPGYGSGFFVATPKMDGGSVKLAEDIKTALPEFNYYKATNDSEHGSSTLSFSNPVASAGYKTIVYEMPGFSSYGEAYKETKNLIGAIFSSI